MKAVFSPDAKSWVEGADSSWFPIQNLPLGRAILRDGSISLIVRIGDFGLVLRDRPNSAAKLSVDDFRSIRREAFDLLTEDNPTLRDNPDKEQTLVPLKQLKLMLPCEIPNFTDFYSGINHASNVGRMFRPDMPPLLPNYRHLPVAYNGRASSLRVSGAHVVRPKGQVKNADNPDPIYVPTRELDFEIELGFYVAHHDPPVSELPVEGAEEHILGVCLVNDWSARDVQRWEYQPLGPFLAKSFLTSVSPWIVSLDALEPFRISGERQDPLPLPHLRSSGPAHFDIEIVGEIQSERMTAPQRLSRTNAKHLYWSFAQQLAHLTSNGLACLPGELCGSGTISGETPEAFGSLLEMTWRGTLPILLAETGEERTFLQDGDTFTMSAHCSGNGYKIGFGSVSGTVLKAK